jgi:Transcription factor WhiB
MRPAEWTERARCLRFADDWELTDRVFHGEAGSGKRYRDGGVYEAQARRCCALCPVRRECLDSALWVEETPQHVLVSTLGGEVKTIRTRPWVQGFFGGTSEKERASTRHLPPAERRVELDRIFRTRAGEVLFAGEAVSP